MVFVMTSSTAMPAEPVSLSAQTLLVIEPSRENPRNSEGDLLVLRDGGIAVVYTRFSGGGADDSAADLAMRVSPDRGKSWSTDRVLVKNEGKANVMSVSLMRLPSGEVLLFYLRKNGWNDCNMFVRRSVDELESISEPVRCTVTPGYHVVNNDRVVRLSTGRLVVPAALHPCPDGTVKTWTSFGIPRVFYSDDDGRTWHADKTVVEPPPKRKYRLQEPGVLELGDGRIWMWMRTDGGSQFACFSRDGGLSWSEPEPTPLASPVSPASIERVPGTNAILAVWNDHSGRHAFPKGRRTPLCVSISRDEGRTWSTSRILESDPNGWYCYTAIEFLDQRVLLAYCAGDNRVGGLNRLKVVSLDVDRLLRGK
jgi:hypothetical protein